MRDWEDLIRAHLRGLELSDSRSEEIVAEFASHLEDHFNELRRSSLSEEEAIQRALDEIPNWNKLRRHLHRATREEDTMNQRVKSLWIPGLAMLSISLLTSVLPGMGLAHMFRHQFLFGSNISLLIDIPWLLSLPLVGALGAFWSRQMGGSMATRLAVCQFPIIITFVIFFVVLPLAFLWDPGMRILRLDFLATYGVSVVLIPSAALLLGALPFLKKNISRNIGPVEIQS